MLEHDNFLSRIVLIDEAKFHVSGRVNRHNCVICGSEPPREYLEHERDSTKVTVCGALTHERVIGPFFFDENIITRNSVLDTLENYALPQLNNSSIIICQLHDTPVCC
jgi:hypothetical protein